MVEKLKEDTDPHDQLFFFELHIERCVESQGSAGMGFCVLILENMKKYLFIFMTVLFVSASFSTPALALGEFEPGGIYNPIKIKIQPSPSEIARQERDKLSQVMARYPQKVSGCEAQYNAIASYREQTLYKTDLSNPSNVVSARQYFEYLFSSYDLCAQRARQIQQATCPVGYQWNSTQTACIPIPTLPSTPTKSRDQGCKDSYGQYSLWNGQTNSAGASICDCASGYQWNSGQTACVSVPKLPGTAHLICGDGYQLNSTQTECIQVPVKSNDQICKENYGVNSVWSGNLNTQGGPICDCASGYQWNANVCVPIVKAKEISIPAKKKIDTHPELPNLIPKENIEIMTVPTTSVAMPIRTSPEKRGFFQWIRSLFRF